MRVHRDRADGGRGRVRHVPARLRRRHDRVRAGHRVRVHRARRPVGQHTRHADVDRLPGGLPRERHVLLGQLRDRSVRHVLVQRRRVSR